MQYDNNKSTFFKKTTTIETYRKRKIMILERDFYVKLTQEELDTINQLPTEYTIDHFCRSILQERWKS